MSKHVSTTLIGSFVAGAVVLLVSGIMIFGGVGFFTTRAKLVLFFDGSVKGLSIGAPVDFRGVRIGSVTDIKIFSDPRDLTFKIPVYIEIEPDRVTRLLVNGKVTGGPRQTAADYDALIERGLRAQLALQSLLTAQLYVLLDFYPEKPARLVGADPDVQELPTIPSKLEQISRTIEALPVDELVARFKDTLEGIERLVNSAELADTIRNLNQTVKDTGTMVRNLDGKIGPLLTDMDKTVIEARRTLEEIRGQVKPLATSADDTLKATRGFVQRADKAVEPVLTSVDATLKSTQAALQQAQKTLASVENVTGDSSALNVELIETLQELQSAARSVRVLSDYLDRHPEALLRGKAENR